MQRIIIINIFILFFSIISCEMDTKVYTITFHANGAIGSPPAPITVYERDYDYGNSDYWDYVPLPDKGNLKYEGKIFYGWNTKADGTGEQYFPSANKYSLYFEVKSNITLYAQWIDALFPPVQNLKLTPGDGMVLSWDEVPGYTELKDIYSFNYLSDGTKFITYVVLRRATNAGSWTTRDFIPYAVTSKPYFRDTRWDISIGGTFEYIVALGVATIKSLGSDVDVVLGSHSNISNSDTVGWGFIGTGNFMAAPTMFEVIVNSANSVTLSWRRAANLNSYPCLGFYVYYNIVPQGSTVDGRNWVQENVFIPYNDTADFNTSFRHTYIKNVSPSSTYYFSVAGVWSDGRGQLATPIMITTPDPPITVTGLKATAYSSSCINLSWNNNDQATAYRIYYEKGSSTIKHIADTIVGTSFSHTGLESDTIYRYSIRAVNIDKESYQYSNTVECKTLLSSNLIDPLFLYITNNSYVPLRTIKINNGENLLISDLYKDTSCKIELTSGTYSVSVYDIEDRQSLFNIVINNIDVRYLINDNFWPLANLTIRNNYSTAISSTFLKLSSTSSWGVNRLTGSLTMNNSQSIGKFNQGLYDAYATSSQYYRVTSGTDVNGITITGGVIDGYQNVFYFFPSVTVSVDTNIIFPANGWSLNKPE